MSSTIQTGNEPLPSYMENVAEVGPWAIHEAKFSKT